MKNGSKFNLEFERPLKELEKRIEEIRLFAEEKQIDMSEEIARIEEKARSLKVEIFKNLTPWQKVQIARHPKRPTFLEYIDLIFMALSNYMVTGCTVMIRRWSGASPI